MNVLPLALEARRRLRPGRLVGEDGDVEIVVAGGEEGILSVVTALGDVVREFWDDDSRNPWQDKY